MAKLRGRTVKEVILRKLQRRLWMREEGVPGDVKEGHFAVHAIGGREPEKFIVNLSYLSRPEFLKLLEQAEEEFGFHNDGVLVVPCHPDELQKVVSAPPQDHKLNCV